MATSIYCEVKSTYNSPQAARRAIKYLRGLYAKKRLHSYRCPHCRCWHITSQNRDGR